jgi:hypothetical protein
MIVGFTTTYAISAYHHWCFEFESKSSGWGVQHYVIKWLAIGQWFSPGPPVSSTNKTDRHDITEILLKVVLNTTKHIIHDITEILLKVVLNTITLTFTWGYKYYYTLCYTGILLFEIKLKITVLQTTSHPHVR